MGAVLPCAGDASSWTFLSPAVPRVARTRTVEVRASWRSRLVGRGPAFQERCRSRQQVQQRGGVCGRRASLRAWSVSRIAVIGSGYVGTVVAACFAHLGHEVVGLEIDRRKLATLREGSAPFYEPGLEDLLAAGTQSGLLRFTDSYHDAMASSDVVFICVGTPPNPDGTPDLRYVHAVASSVASTIEHYHIFVNKSTVPIGTGQWLTDELGKQVSPELFSVVSNPEFLREGNAVYDFLHPERVIVGSNDAHAVETLAHIYKPILDQRLPGFPPGEPVPLLRTTMPTAEMAKYASNAFLATKISFINEIARLCEIVGADVTEVSHAMGLDPRIGNQFLGAGLGWGGSCLGKDVGAVISAADDHGYRPRILEAALAVNRDQPRLAVRHLRDELGPLAGARIGVLGLAFKAGTDDLRESPAIEVCGQLLEAGASVAAYDPLVASVPQLPVLVLAKSPYEVADGVDAIVVATDSPELLDVDLSRLRSVMRGSVFLDGRNAFDPASVIGAGFRYVGIGRSLTLETSRPNGRTASI